MVLLYNVNSTLAEPPTLMNIDWIINHYYFCIISFVLCIQHTSTPDGCRQVYCTPWTHVRLYKPSKYLLPRLSKLIGAFHTNNVVFIEVQRKLQMDTSLNSCSAKFIILCSILRRHHLKLRATSLPRLTNTLVRSFVVCH